MIIEVEHVTRRFGARVALDDVSLSVPRGVCFGFLGPNGAGKTTLIRLLLGLARPTQGRVRVRGTDVHQDAETALRRVGGICEEPRFYPHLTGRENLDAFAAPLGPHAKARVPAALDRVGLAARSGDRVKGYSLGMRQRLGVARALLSDPELLVLDEPTNGLDPAGIAEFRELVRSFVEEEGRTVFISSHLLDEIEKMCDHVAIVNQGAVLLEGSVRDLIDTGEVGLRVDCEAPDRAVALLDGWDGVRSVRREPDGTLFVETDPTRERAAAINRALVDGDAGVVAFGKSEQTLEQRYLEITGGKDGQIG